jgi:hypothetical protein
MPWQRSGGSELGRLAFCGFGQWALGESRLVQVLPASRSSRMWRGVARAWTIPSVRYARSGDVHVAYQVVGDGLACHRQGVYRAPDYEEQLIDAGTFRTEAVASCGTCDPPARGRSGKGVSPTSVTSSSTCCPICAGRSDAIPLSVSPCAVSPCLSPGWRADEPDPPSPRIAMCCGDEIKASSPI